MWSDYTLEKLPDVSGPDLVEAGRYRMVSKPTFTVSWARVSQLRGMVCMAGVDPKWSHSMAHTLALDTWTWPRGDLPSLGWIDEDIDLLRVRG